MADSKENIITNEIMVVKGLNLKLGDSVNGTLNFFILCKLGSA